MNQTKIVEKRETGKSKIVMNETRTAVVNALKGATDALTLREISDLIGKEVKSGSTNALIQAGVIKVAGTKKVAVTSYREVNVYELGDLSVLQEINEAK